MPERIYAEYLDFANKLADASGKILRSSFKSPVNIAQKADLTPVTQADTEAEGQIRSLIEEKFPDHGIIGEEFGGIRPESPYQWVIDPIDGTKSFIAGYPIFTTLIALLHHGKPILGLIDQPVLSERWAAVINQPALYNDTPLPVLPDRNILPLSNIATTSFKYFTGAQAEKFARLQASCANTISGGDAYAYAMLASGRLDIVLDAGMKPYDFCALAPIIEGVGGIISDWQGQPLSLLSDGTVLAAASTQLHTQALSLLNKK
jgi:histidinol phosphatase-like enzyme (inositol monophosphatase family)